MVNKEKIIEVLIKEYGEKKLMRLYDSEYSDIFKDVIKLTEKQAKKEILDKIRIILDNKENHIEHYQESMCDDELTTLLDDIRSDLADLEKLKQEVK